MTKMVPQPQNGGANPALEPSGPSSAAAVPFARWQRARDRACAAVLAGETRLLITGPAGTGKTVMVQEIARILRYAGWEAVVRVARMDKVSADTPAGPQSVLLIDEADRLDDTELLSLAGRSSGTIVLAGLDSIGVRWEAGVRISLTPLGRADALAYVAQWLAIAGHTPDHLDQAAAERVVELGSGIPRLLSSLLSAAMWLGETAGVGTVTVRQVDDAAALRSCLLDSEEAPPRPVPPPTEAPPPAAQISPEPSKPPALATEPTPTADRPLEPSAADPVVPVLPEPAAVPARRRRVLVPVLAGVTAFAVAVGGASVYRWPSETAQATQALKARLAHYMQLTGWAEPAAVAQHAPVVAPSAYLASAAPAQQADLPAAFEPVRLAVEAPALPPRAEPPTPSEAKAAPEGELKAAASPEPPPEPSREAAAPAGAASSEQVAAVPEPVQAPSPKHELAALQPEPAPQAAAPLPPAPAPAAPREIAAPPAEQPAEVQQAALVVMPAPPPRPVAAPAPALQQAAPTPLSPALIETLLRRGNEMQALGDWSAARLLFGRAAQAGHSGAMLALGRTYDPDSANAGGSQQQGDAAIAADWYRRAAAAGSTEAAALLRQIELHAAK